MKDRSAFIRFSFFDFPERYNIIYMPIFYYQRIFYYTIVIPYKNCTILLLHFSGRRRKKCVQEIKGILYQHNGQVEISNDTNVVFGYFCLIAISDKVSIGRKLQKKHKKSKRKEKYKLRLRNRLLDIL